MNLCDLPKGRTTCQNVKILEEHGLQQTMPNLTGNEFA